MKLLTALMMVAFWPGLAAASPETDFWKWFQKEESKLYAFESDRDAVFDSLSEAMQRVNPDLTFEFGPIVKGRREFVISAGGITSAFPAVESLYRAAPSLPRWKWTKYRQRRPDLMDISLQGKTVKADDVRFVMAKDEDKVGIILFFGDYAESEKLTFAQIGYLFLDQALGEYAVETQVGFIEFAGHDSSYFDQSSPLSELAKRFDNYWKSESR